MALPTLEKTWQFDVNQSVGGLGSDHDPLDFFYKVKESMIGFASGHWTVTSSSNSVTASLGDNWSSWSDVVINNAAHSWIILTNSATGAEFCIDCTGAWYDPHHIPVFFSPGGGYATTGLVTTARPTPPADEVSLGFTYGAPTNFTGKLHVMMSDDGECTRVALCITAHCVLLWIIDAVKTPAAGWTTPNVCTAWGTSSSSSDGPTYGNYNDTAKVYSYITAEFTMYMTSEGYASGMLGQNSAGTNPDSQLNSWLMCPIGLASQTTGHIGRKGELYDIWWGSTTRASGDSYPADTTYQFVQLGDMILPWNGTAPEVIG